MAKPDSSKQDEMNREKGFREFRDMLKSFKSAKDDYLHSYRRDPLASFLIKNLKFTPVKSALLGFGIVFLTYLAGYIVHFLMGEEVAGITMTPLDIVYDFFIIPVIYGYYLWISTRPSYVLLKIKENGVLLGTEKEFDKFISLHSNYIINHRWVHLISFLTAAGLVVTTISLAAAGSDLWGPENANYSILYFIKIPITWAIPQYMVCVIYLKELLSIWTFRKLLKHEELEINMFHRDRCGGLKPISDYLLTFTYFIMACGFAFVLLITRSIEFGYFKEDIFVNLSLFVYICISYVFFYFPLHPVHNLMQKLREDIKDTLQPGQFIPSRAFTFSTAGKLASAISAPILVFTIFASDKLSFLFYPIPLIFLAAIFLHLVFVSRSFAVET